MYEDIAKEVHNAAIDKSKMAMFHLQVLKNANELASVDGTVFCRAIGVPDSYAYEFRKMIKLADVMKQQGIKLL